MLVFLSKENLKYKINKRLIIIWIIRWDFFKILIWSDVIKMGSVIKIWMKYNRYLNYTEKFLNSDIIIIKC